LKPIPQLLSPPSLRASAKRVNEAIQRGACLSTHAWHWIASLARFALARNDGGGGNAKLINYT